jgi:Integrator complex subunit 3 N-terminal
VLGGGREMMRALHEVMKLNEMEFISTALGQEDETGKIIYRKMLVNGYREKDTHPSSLVILQMPPFVEQYIGFILNNSSKQNFNKHLGWLLEKLEINQGSISEYILVDVIRFVLLCTDNSHSTHSGEKVHRWYILGWLLRYIKSDIFRMMAKQALFIDWLFYRGESGWYKVFEPAWLLVINSIAKYKDMSEELLDFLFLLTKDFDSGNPDCDACVMRVFEVFKSRGVTR